MANRDPIEIGIDYAERVASGKEIAPRYTIKAAKRFLVDYAAAERGEGMWRFDPARARRPILVCEGLPNIKGPFAGHNIALMDWQLWITINLFGFVERETGLRRFR